MSKLSAVSRQLGIQSRLVFIVSVLSWTAKAEMDKSPDGNIFRGSRGLKIRKTT